MAKTKASPYASESAHNRVMDYEYTFGWTDDDKRLLERLQSFIPERVFDAHAHLHSVDFMPEDANLFTGFGTADAGRFLADQKALYGNRRVRALLLPTPSELFNEKPELIQEMNKWMNEELKKAPDCVGAIYVKSDHTKEEIQKIFYYNACNLFGLED